MCYLHPPVHRSSKWRISRGFHFSSFASWEENPHTRSLALKQALLTHFEIASDVAEYPDFGGQAKHLEDLEPA